MNTQDILAALCNPSVPKLSYGWQQEITPEMELVIVTEPCEGFIHLYDLTGECSLYDHQPACSARLPTN